MRRPGKNRNRQKGRIMANIIVVCGVRIGERIPRIIVLIVRQTKVEILSAVRALEKVLLDIAE